MLVETLCRTWHLAGGLVYTSATQQARQELLKREGWAVLEVAMEVVGLAVVDSEAAWVVEDSAAAPEEAMGAADWVVV